MHPQEPLPRIEITKAAGPPTVPDVEIHIYGEPPDFQGDNWRGLYGQWYDAEAERLVEALCRSLPGGTLDRVLVKLLERKASLFRIPLFGEREKEE